MKTESLLTLTFSETYVSDSCIYLCLAQFIGFIIVRVAINILFMLCLEGLQSVSILPKEDRETVVCSPDDAVHQNGYPATRQHAASSS